MSNLDPNPIRITPNRGYCDNFFEIYSHLAEKITEIEGMIKQVCPNMILPLGSNFYLNDQSVTHMTDFPNYSSKPNIIPI